MLRTAQPDRAASAFFDKDAPSWQRRYENRTYRQRREFILAEVRSELSKRGDGADDIQVLDFGCGSGVLVEALLGLGVRVTGVDTSRAMVDEARAHLSSWKERVELKWLQAGSDLEDCTARNYDLVLAISVLEFVDSLEFVVDRLCSAVRPGGLLILSVPNRQSWLRKVERMIFRWPQAFRRIRVLAHLTQSESYLKYQKHQFVRSEVKRMIEVHGFDEQSHSFAVAPRWLDGLSGNSMIGMMLFSVFRKPGPVDDSNLKP